MVEFSVSSEESDEPPPPGGDGEHIEEFSVEDNYSSLAQALYATLEGYYAGQRSEERKLYLEQRSEERWLELPELFTQYAPFFVKTFRPREGLYCPPPPVPEEEVDPLAGLDTRAEMSELVIDFSDLDTANAQYSLDTTPSLGIDEIDAILGIHRDTDRQEYVLKRWLHTVWHGTGTQSHSSLNGYVQ